jgi:hypothetical protein
MLEKWGHYKFEYVSIAFLWIQQIPFLFYLFFMLLHFSYSNSNGDMAQG